MGLRRWYTNRLRRRSAPDWPILPAAATPPPGWPGWFQGRRFAFVITHDVEGPAGLARVRRLAELEMSLGFRSSYNFIPEGTYAVPEGLRTWLVDHGFEVGVHDLHHDGSLYRRHSGFSRQAVKINEYLRRWKAVGFRGGFMFKNLDWLHELEIEYDASTFDYDPFEPQPSGLETLFPKWIPLPATSAGSSTGFARRGYVELPYTLPQDSTLFLLLCETTPALWLKKLDWVSLNGGMALVNVHPDYLRFPDEMEDGRTYPVDHYLQLLGAVQDRHSEVWNPRARDLAAWYSNLIR